VKVKEAFPWTRGRQGFCRRPAQFFAFLLQSCA
jgi:hypothetical protein